MNSKVVYKSTFHKTNSIYLVLCSLFMYFMLYQFHGFQVFGDDSIDTVSYAMWMNDSNLFSNDFHLSNIIPSNINERTLSAILLHLFGDHMEWGSRILHFLFTFLLCAGLIRFADLIIKHFTLSVVVVFATLFPLYHINIGGNELYFNMFNPSLVANSIGIWAMIFAYMKRYFYTGIILGLATLFQPITGCQLFVVLLPIIFVLNGFKKETFYYIGSYIFTGGLFVLLIFLGARGPNIEASVSYYDLVKFRNAHHFIPAFSHKSHIIFHLLLYILSIILYLRKNRFLVLFFGIALAGLAVYLLGVSLKIDNVLYTQFLRINIWLKCIAVIGLIAFLKSMLEQKQLNILSISLFMITLIFSLTRFKPTYDAEYPLDIYTWVHIHTQVDDLFLVPPELNDFKVRTKRPTYFDYHSRVFQKTVLFQWNERFQKIYGKDVKDRSQEMNIPDELDQQYLKGNGWKREDIDYVITKINQEISERELVFSGSDFKIFR